MPKVLMLQPGWKARQEKRAIPSVANLSVILRTAVFAGRRTHVPAGSAYTARKYMGPFGKLRAGSLSGVSRFRDRLRFLRMTRKWDGFSWPFRDFDLGKAAYRIADGWRTSVTRV